MSDSPDAALPAIAPELTPEAQEVAAATPAPQAPTEPEAVAPQLTFEQLAEVFKERTLTLREASEKADIAKLNFEATARLRNAAQQRLTDTLQQMMNAVGLPVAVTSTRDPE